MKKISSILLSSLAIVATNHAVAESYSSTIAKSYATSNYNTPYTKSWWTPWVTPNPFPDLGAQTSGGNCTNFASQSILAGLTGLTSPTPTNVYGKRSNFLIDRADAQSWYLACNEPKVGSGLTNCRSYSWGLASNMKLYADDSIARATTKKGLRFRFRAKTSYDGTKLSLLDYTKVQVGDIIFVDFSYDRDTRIDHTVIVTDKVALQAKDPKNPTTVEKYNTIRLTYQTNNKTGVKLGDTFYTANTALYVYQPVDYVR